MIIILLLYIILKLKCFKKITNRCNIDCANDPDNCIRSVQSNYYFSDDIFINVTVFSYIYDYSERLFMKMADLMASEGYLAAGYNILSLDDCWLDHKRSKSDQLQPDASRFPSGIKALADYASFYLCLNP